MTGLRLWVISVSIVMSPIGMIGCDNRNARDPKRCMVVDAGEAADLAAQDVIPDDRMVRVGGLADPRSLVWRNERSGKTYFLAKIMGSGQRLWYVRVLAPGETPGVPTEFEGHILRWDRLPESDGKPLAQALAAEYGIRIAEHSTYLINAASQPTGCP